MNHSIAVVIGPLEFALQLRCNVSRNALRVKRTHQSDVRAQTKELREVDGGAALGDLVEEELSWSHTDCEATSLESSVNLTRIERAVAILFRPVGMRFPQTIENAHAVTLSERLLHQSDELVHRGVLKEVFHANEEKQDSWERSYRWFRICPCRRPSQA